MQQVFLEIVFFIIPKEIYKSASNDDLFVFMYDMKNRRNFCISINFNSLTLVDARRYKCSFAFFRVYVFFFYTELLTAKYMHASSIYTESVDD